MNNVSFNYSSAEIPQYRLPYDVVNFEVEMMKDLGVKVHYSQTRSSVLPKNQDLVLLFKI